mgnify:CR=1 FL=1
MPNLKGVVLETYGSGNAPTRNTFITYLSNAINKGIKIINVTQCIGGSVIQGHYETSVALKEIGVISGFDITLEAAVAKLMYLLSLNLSDTDFKSYYESSLRGEITKKH